MQKILIGQNIRQLRDIKGFSQEYMAEHLGISVTAYSNLERGESSPSWDRLEQIAKILDIDLLKMVTFDGKSIFGDNNSNNNSNNICGSNNVVSSLPDQERQLYETKIAALEKEVALKDEIIALLKK
jgi:transcriptional regulator with XRE-family HTH domain